MIKAVVPVRDIHEKTGTAVFLYYDKSHTLLISFLTIFPFL